MNDSTHRFERDRLFKKWGQFKSLKLEKKVLAQFFSRNNLSGTNIKERSICKAIDLQPWTIEKKWYHKRSVFPPGALIYAEKNRLYTVTDWGTWLFNQDKIPHLEIYAQGGKSLLNTCFVLLC